MATHDHRQTAPLPLKMITKIYFYFVFNFKLHEAGYTIIDAIEPSFGMIAKAKQYNTYRHYYSDYVGTNQLPIQSGEYSRLAVSVNIL